MQGITTAGYVILFGLAIVGIIAIVKCYKNNKK